MITRIEIDPNVRVRGNGTFSAFMHVDGPLAVGQEVEVFEPEEDIVGEGRVTEIDVTKHLVYLSVDWSSLRCRQDYPSNDIGTLLMASSEIFQTVQPGILVKVADLGTPTQGTWAARPGGSVLNVRKEQINLVVSK